MEKINLENYKNEYGAYDLRKIPFEESTEQLVEIYKSLTADDNIVVAGDDVTKKINIEDFKNEDDVYDLREMPVEQMEDIYKTLGPEDTIIVNKSVMDKLIDIFPEED